MKLVIERHGLVIIPENEADKAYIEDTLGLRYRGDSIPLRRSRRYGSEGESECLETDERGENDT